MKNLHAIVLGATGATGAAGSDATNFDTTGELADVSTVTVNYNKVIQTVVSVACDALKNICRC